MRTILDTGTHKIEVGGVKAPPSRIVSMSDFGELLPDAVIVELEDFKADTEATPGRRQAAARVLLRIASSVQIDAYSDKMTQLLTKLVTHTSLTSEQAGAILDVLKQ